MSFETDHLGFLKNATDWNPQWAQTVAKANSIAWEPIDETIVSELRNFYFEFDLSPAMRPLVKLIKTKVGSEQGNSMWLMQRYGESPARTLALLAGLPKPKNCL